MAVTDLADLFVATSEYVGRADFAHLFPRFVSLAEIEIERSVRLVEQQKSVLLTLVAGRATMPTDFYAMRSVETTSSPTQHMMLISYHADLEPNDQNALGYWFEGGEICVTNRAMTQIRLAYYAKIPRLTGAAPTNWLLTRAPDVMLAGAIAQVLVWANDERAMGAREAFAASVAGLKNDERARRMVNGQIVTAGGLP